MEIRKYTEYREAEILNLYDSVGWTAYTEQPNVRQIELTTDNTPKTVAFYRSQGFKEMSKIGCCGFIKV